MYFSVTITGFLHCTVSISQLLKKNLSKKKSNKQLLCTNTTIYSIGSGPRRNKIWTEGKTSFYWCVISRYIFVSYSMWFLSSLSNPEVQSGAVITTSLAHPP